MVSEPMHQILPTTRFQSLAINFLLHLANKKRNYKNLNLNETFGHCLISFIFEFRFLRYLSMDSRWPEHPGVFPQLRYYVRRPVNRQPGFQARDP